MNILRDAPLGKKTAYISHYKKELLFPIARQMNRSKLNLINSLPFSGVDIWNAYELSWLNSKGKPIVALAEFIFPCESSYLIEAKSFKLYLNSFNNTPISSVDELINTLKRDLEEVIQAPVQVTVVLVDEVKPIKTAIFSGICLDTLDIECDTYLVKPDLLQTQPEIISETLYSNLLKSNCLITGQPDWGSVQICYTGKKILHDSLLKYIISFRDHTEFGEQCVERIFLDIMEHCKPQKLSVYARYTRRGGLDINPYRSTDKGIMPDNFRLCRQ
ncbi:MAG: queF [Gammaproteobacteria bacterium]|jgi:7-cyano-7-deazaguanine reductase|nr:queF [Gammaproteobacteria bacterium]